MSPLPSRGSPTLQSGGGGGVNQKWPTCGQSGYVTPAVSGIPTASERGGGGGIRSGPLVGKVATSPLLSRGSPSLQSEGQNQKWPTCGQSGYVTPAVSRIPTASERGAKSEVAHLWAKWLRHPCRLEVAHLWAKWLRHPCRLEDLHRCRAREGGNQKWPTCGQSGYVTPAVSGITTASERGGEIRSGPLVAKVATSPLPSLGSPPLQSGGGGGIRSGPLVAKVATSPLPSRGSPPLQSRGGKSEVPHLWQKWLRHARRLGDPHRCRAGGGGGKKWPTCGQSGYVTPAISGIPTASERGENQKWPTCGQSGYVTPAVSGIPTAAERGRGGGSEVAHLWAKWLRHPCRLGNTTASERGGKSEVAHLWARWLRHPCRLGDPHHGSFFFY